MAKSNKVLIMVRTSTESQSIDAQHKEMVDFCKQQGYKEEDMIFMEEQGASAAKMDNKYLELINRIKEEIERNKDIKCFACWHLNRAFRTEEAYIDIKSFLVSRGIQMIVKNPYLVLLNDDGTINNGMEMAMALFAVLNKQDNLERKAKFKRAKSAMAKIGKFAGGHSRKFGYKVDENNYLIPDEYESEVVKLIFDLYSTGEYSAYSLAKEMNSRGYTRFGKPFDRRFVSNIIQSKQYTGLPSEKWNDRVYPPIISIEMFEKCRGIADGNRIVLRQGKKMVLCSKLVKCPECGKSFTSKSTHFRCNSVEEDMCTNTITLKESVVDLVAWRVAFDEHLKYLIEVSQNNTKTYTERISVIEQKISTLQVIITESDTKKKRIVDTYLEGYIDKKERDIRLSRLQDDVVIQQKEISALEDEKRAIMTLLDNVDKELNEMIDIDTMNAMSNNIKSDTDRYNIIHKHILKIVPSRCQYGEKGRRVKGLNAVLIEIYTIKGDLHKVIYLPKAQRGNNLYTYHDEKGLWLGEWI